MNRDELLSTDKYYQDNEDHWKFYKAAWGGHIELLKYGILDKDSFDDPKKYLEHGRAWGMNFSEEINGVISGFIADSEFSVDYGQIADNENFKKFLRDCDLSGSDYPAWWNSQREISGVYGECGILVDQAQGGSPAELSQLDIYPYVSSYSPLDILMRIYDRDPITNRPYLSYLKIRQYYPDTVMIWTPENFETWALPADEKEKPYIIDSGSGENQLGYIPFLYLYCMRNPIKPNEGQGNIKGIADIDATIVVDSICASAIIYKTAFPMPVLPREEDNPANPEKEVGPGRIIEIGPEDRDPFWMAPKASEAIDPILKLWAEKKSRVYEMAALSSIKASSQSIQSRSGESMEQLYRQLYGKLAKMVGNEVEARLNVMKYWLAWQNKSELFESVKISHNRNFDIQKLVTQIEDILTEKVILKDSDTAQKELAKNVVQHGSLSDIDNETMSKIFNEIESSKPIDTEVLIEK